MDDSMKIMQIDESAADSGPVLTKKQRRIRHKQIVAGLLNDYASNSTLHGLRYISSRELTLCEKVFWLTMFLVSISMCGYLINNVYVKWQTSPVIITVNEQLVSISSIPFPSITICPQIKTVSSVYNYTAAELKMQEMLTQNKSLDPNDLEMYEDIALICYPHFVTPTLKTTRLFSNISVVKKINRVSQARIIHNCWRNNTSCGSYFKGVLTSEGWCFNMNGLPANELFRDAVQSDYKYTTSNISSRGWSFVNGYNNSESEPYPIRGSEDENIEIMLFTNTTHRDNFCDGVLTGFKIYISHPADLPQTSLHHYAAVDGELSTLAVNVHVLNTSETLRGYRAEDRQCYFPEDRQLRYFKLYTFKNCRAECLSNYTFAKCGCVGFYMPFHDSNRICTLQSRPCMKAAKDFMTVEELRIQADREERGCRCLQSCYSVEYDAEILKTEFEMADVLEDFLQKKYGNLSFSMVTIHFKKPEYVSMRRSELFGVTDFLANIGGLLGLFLGFSFISLVELVYFITLRIGLRLNR